MGASAEFDSFQPVTWPNYIIFEWNQLSQILKKAGLFLEFGRQIFLKA